MEYIDQLNYDVLRKKYLKMFKSLGMNETITSLHREIGKLEVDIYEGGYQKDRLQLVQKLRELSREIWSKQFSMK